MPPLAPTEVGVGDSLLELTDSACTRNQSTTAECVTGFTSGQYLVA